MASKNISIRRDVYKRLRLEKKPDESFTDVIDRLLKSGKPPLTKFSGAISEKTANRMEDALGEISKMDMIKIAKLSEDPK